MTEINEILGHRELTSEKKKYTAELFFYVHGLRVPSEKQCHSPLTIVLIEPPHDKTNKMACAPSEDSDQPGHPPSLIRVFVVRLMGSKGPKLSSCGQRRLIRLGGCPGWSESSLGAHAILLVLSWGGSHSTRSEMLWSATFFHKREKDYVPR